MSVFGYVLGFFWGCVIGAFAQFTPLGQWVSKRMFWLLVHFVAAGDMVILLMMTEDGMLQWREAALTLLLTTIGPTIQGVWSLYLYFRGWTGDEDEAAEQDAMGLAGLSSRDGWG